MPCRVVVAGGVLVVVVFGGGGGVLVVVVAAVARDSSLQSCNQYRRNSGRWESAIFADVLVLPVLQKEI